MWVRVLKQCYQSFSGRGLDLADPPANYKKQEVSQKKYVDALKQNAPRSQKPESFFDTMLEYWHI